MSNFNLEKMISGQTLSAFQLLSGNHRIPLYQRDFVWKEEQVKALWDDLFDHYEACTRNDEFDFTKGPHGYFIGAMVVIKGKANERDEVIDGQQRLTSLTCMAAVLLAELNALEIPKKSTETTKARKRNLEDMTAHAEGGSFRPRLNFENQETLTNFLLESTYNNQTWEAKESFWNKPDSKKILARKKGPHLKLKNAMAVGKISLTKFLGKHKKREAKLKRLESFISLFTEGLTVLRIAADTASSAYTIFESLNNRGIPLSQADLIKNELLKVFGNDPEKVKDIGGMWQEIRQDIDGIDVKSLSMLDFLHYSYLSRHKLVKVKDLYKTIQETLVSKESAKDFVDELREDCNAMQELTGSPIEGWTPDTKEMLKDIQSVLNVRYCYPFLIAAYRHHHQDPDLMQRYVKAVMNFAFRYMKVIDGPLSNFIGSISEATEKINAGAKIEEVIKVFRNAAPDKDFQIKFEELSIPNTKLAYFIVYHIECSLLNGTRPELHGLFQNLEHVMPKNPDKEWKQAAAMKRNKAEEFNDLIWRIGNLIPLPAEINKSLKNRSISYKIKNETGKDYTTKGSSGTTLESPKDIEKYLEAGEWTANSISERQKALAAKAVGVWSLD